MHAFDRCFVGSIPIVVHTDSALDSRTWCLVITWITDVVEEVLRWIQCNVQNKKCPSNVIDLGWVGIYCPLIVDPDAPGFSVT